MITVKRDSIEAMIRRNTLFNSIRKKLSAKPSYVIIGIDEHEMEEIICVLWSEPLAKKVMDAMSEGEHHIERI